MRPSAAKFKKSPYQTDKSPGNIITHFTQFWNVRVDLIDITPTYANVRHKSGREQTVSLRDLAPLPRIEEPAGTSESSVDDIVITEFHTPVPRISKDSPSAERTVSVNVDFPNIPASSNDTV